MRLTPAQQEIIIGVAIYGAEKELDRLMRMITAIVQHTGTYPLEVSNLYCVAAHAASELAAARAFYEQKVAERIDQEYLEAVMETLKADEDQRVATKPLE